MEIWKGTPKLYPLDCFQGAVRHRAGQHVAWHGICSLFKIKPFQYVTVPFFSYFLALQNRIFHSFSFYLTVLKPPPPYCIIYLILSVKKQSWLCCYSELYLYLYFQSSRHHSSSKYRLIVFYVVFILIFSEFTSIFKL